MVSRRTVLASGSAAVLAALAGCASGDDDATPEPTDEPTDASGTNSPPDTAETESAKYYSLDADPVDPGDVSDGAVLGVASPDLHQLVVDAASADSRVDLTRTGDTPDGTLALGAFEYLRFRTETYEATASFAGFAEEAAYSYELESVEADQVDGDVLRYADLNDSERAIADQLLSGDYSVGHHEEKPESLAPFDEHGYLRAENETYRILQTVGDHAAHHMLTLEPADPGEDSQVVTVADRVPASGWVDELRTAVQLGDTGLGGVSDRDALEGYLDDVDYVVTAVGVAEMRMLRAVK